MNPRIAVTPNPKIISMGIIISMMSVSIPLMAEEIAVNPCVISQVERIKPFVNAAIVALIGPIPSTSGIVDAVQSTLGNAKGIVISTIMGNTRVKTPALVPLPPNQSAIKPTNSGATRNTDPGTLSMPKTSPANNPRSEPVML